MEAIIVGAGIIGASIAWRLAQRGVKVTLVDQGTMGGEASHAGAGMLAPGGEYSTRSRWARLAVDSLAAYPEFVRELEEASGVKIDFRICGAYEFCRTDDELEALRLKAGEQVALGIFSLITASSELHRYAPLAATKGWQTLLRHYPQEAVVDPRDVMRALRIVLPALGVKIVEHQRVAALAADGRGVSAGPLRADVAVLAAGAWSSGVGLNPPAELAESEPVKGHLLGYQLPPRSIDPILRYGHTYIVQRGNGYTIAGATTERLGFDRNVDPDAGRRIAEAAQQLVPALATMGKPELWCGLRPGTKGGEPEVGRIGSTPIWASYGHYRNGILLAPVNAQLITDEILS